MKNTGLYKVFFEDNDWDMSATIKANSSIEALKKWYMHINQIAGAFKNFRYSVKSY